MNKIVPLGSACDTVRAITELLTLKTPLVIVTTPKNTQRQKHLKEKKRISGKKGKVKE